MFTVYKKTLDFGGRELTIETGRMARQADGSALVKYGETVVLATACFAKSAKEGQDFFPLTVNYQEKFYAAGRIPGGFLKREGRPSEKETLTSRLIDRPIRPLFPKGFKNEVQVLINVLSVDGENDPDMVGMIAASAALTFSGAPFLGPIAGCRVGYIDGEYVLNPTVSSMADSALDLTVAGTREGVLMVESEAAELSEDVMLGAVNFGHDAGQKVIDAIIEVAEALNKPGFEMEEPEDTSELEAALVAKFGEDIKNGYKIKAKQERVAALSAVREAAVAEFGGAEGEYATKVASLIKGLEADVLRRDVLENKIRIDGRDPFTVRPIVAEVDVIPNVHASALFTRGETQALVVATLGSGRDEQLIDAIEGEYKDRFMLHYNFPPSSVGECGRVGSPGRREIGHGKLARRSLQRMLPDAESFPYVTRLVSEILESNGSSSMATVCGSSMALMAAGVPLERPVSGIAMGLVKEGDDFVVLSDIMGDEDHLGDMDFKVAGTEKGLTALQMDIKITSITKEIMEVALKQAQAGRLHILEKMAMAISSSRAEVSDNAPGMESFQIDKEKIREVIGTGGKVIRGLTEETGCSIDISEEGVVTVAAVDRASLKDCVERIKGIVAEPEMGETYTGKVVSVTDFGCFVRFLPSHEGLVHVSEMVPVRVNSATDLMNEGDELTVKVIGFDRGKVRLSIKEIEQTDEIMQRLKEATENGEPRRERSEGDGERRDRKPRGDRDGNRGRGDRRPRRNED